MTKKQAKELEALQADARKDLHYAMLFTERSQYEDALLAARCAVGKLERLAAVDGRKPGTIHYGPVVSSRKPDAAA